MPRWDFECPRCGHTREVVFATVALAEADHHVICPECDMLTGAQVVMKRLPAAPSFYVGGFNAKNGYSK